MPALKIWTGALLLLSAEARAGTSFELPPTTDGSGLRTAQEGARWLETLRNYAADEQRCEPMRTSAQLTSCVFLAQLNPE